MNMYDVPGLADQVSETVLSAWNQQINRIFGQQQQTWGNRFMVLDPAVISNSNVTDAVKWVGNPAEPEFCQNTEVARQLSDFGQRGREILHNEYLEYHVTFQVDAQGRQRPKRVEVTTELREYWLTLAIQDPIKMQEIAQEILGQSIPFSAFYGPGVTNPNQLSPQERERLFSMFVAGDGRGSRPIGSLNRENALFMGHPINGLDDLIFIVMFGATPRRVSVNGGSRKAQLHEIFRAAQTTFLACRHADPAAAAAAHDTAWEGRTVAFANPLGMYIRTFTSDVFSFNGQPIPENWIRFSRGNPNLHQRLEFGPADNEPFFLDDIVVAEGGEDRPLTGGYDVVAKIEVGPMIVVGQPTTIAENEFLEIPASEPIRCREADVCSSIAQLKAEFDAQPMQVRTGPRRMGAVK
jgi:hypothetical protein